MKQKNGYTVTSKILTIAFVLICLVWIMPIVEVLLNSFKANAFVNTETFALPNADSFVGWANYVKGMTFGNYPVLHAVGYSVWISVVSTILNSSQTV